MSRIIFILVLLVVGFLLLKSWQRKNSLTKTKSRDSGRINQNTRIVPCAHCGLHVPEPKAVQYGGKFFCSLEHAQQAQATLNQEHHSDRR